MASADLPAGREHASTVTAEYFPAVDGLRALAVASVVAYHLNGMVPGGFVGVDIFFVISGFVVAFASANLPGRSAGAFFAAFYARRLLRIAPALIVCVVLTVLATVLLVPDAWLSASNRLTSLAALFGLSNYVLALTTNDYWAPRSEFNPFTHTWSLGVEEQFYLLAPLLFYAWRRGHARRVFQLLVVLAAASLLAAALSPGLKQQTLAFYSIHTRFWELAIGVALAITHRQWRPWIAGLSGVVRGLLGALALLLVGGALGLADSLAFPWPWALPPVLGTALLIQLTVAHPQGPVGRCFASAPMVWLGRLSYSLYLWHWPVIVLMRWTVGVDTPWLKAIALAVALLLAMASLKFVEWPLRHLRFGSATSRARIAGGGALALGIAAIVSAGIWVARPALSLSVTQRADWNWETDLPVPAPRCELALTKEKAAGGLLFDMRPSGCGEPAGRLFVAGDSHAGAYVALLKKYVRVEGVHVRLYTYAGCSVFGLQQPVHDGSPACRRFIEDVLATVQREARPGDVLFLPGLRIPRLADQWETSGAQPAEPGARRAEAIQEALTLLAPLSQRGVAVLFEAPKPVFAVPPFRCADWFNAANPICRGEHAVTRQRMETLRAPVIGSMAAIVQGLPHAAVYDPFPLLCGAERCEPFRDGRPLFMDGDHLSGFGNSTLYESFRAAVAASRAR